jgi:hypothetical protein
MAWGGGEGSLFGVCQACPDSQVSSDQRQGCDNCPPAQAAMVDDSHPIDRFCGCAPGFVNATNVPMACFAEGYDP